MTLELDTVVAYFAASLCAILGVAVFSLDRRSFVHRTFALGMAALGASEVFVGLGASAQWLSAVVRWERLRLLCLAPAPGLWLLFSLSFARSNYRELVHRWRWTVAAVFVVPVALASLFGDAMFAIPGDWNEFVASMLPLGWAGRLFHGCLLIGAVLVLSQLESTLRAAGGGKRWQTKFMVLGVGSWFAAQIYLLGQTLLFSAVDRSLTAMGSWVVVVAGGLIVVSLIRNPLLAAEMYLSDTALYRSVVLLLAGAYLIAVGLLAHAIDTFRERERFSLAVLFIFLSLVALAVLLLSDALLLRVRRFLARHFERPRYDYRREWTTFTERTTSLVDVYGLCAAVTKRANRTRSEEHTSELQSLAYLVCRLLLEKKKTNRPSIARRTKGATWRINYRTTLPQVRDGLTPQPGLLPSRRQKDHQVPSQAQALRHRHR